MRRDLFVFLTIICISTSGLTQSRTADPRVSAPISVPLQAELLAPLDVRKVGLGTSVAAKAKAEWNTPFCHLRDGSLIIGRVVDVKQQSKGSKGSSITVAFYQANCQGKITPINLILFAIVATPPIDEGAAMAEISVLHDPLGPSTTGINATTMYGTGNRLALAHSVQSLDSRTKSAGSAANTDLPSTLKAGQVIGLRKVTLSVGTGLGNASVLSSEKNNIRLERATQLVLMAVPIPQPLSDFSHENLENTAESAKTVITELPKATPSEPDPKVIQLERELDEAEICIAPCSVVPELSDAKPAQASLTLTTKSLGFTAHDLGFHTSFGFESTLSYIDSQNLLFTYDPHKLRKRFADGFRTESFRTIRAIVLDPLTLEVKHAVDWQIQGEGQYIWHVGPDEVLVHIGRFLRIFDANLKIVREVSVPGEIAFVSPSPSGNRIAVGFLRERHTRAIHNDLEKAIGEEPEEDVDIELLDRNFNVVLTARQNSQLSPPTLTDGGELRVNSTGKTRWRIHEVRWDHTDHTIASLSSMCRPIVAPASSDRVFVIGCGKSPLQNWYRIVRLDGSPVLSGHASPLKLERCLSSNQGEFAIRVVHAKPSKLRGERFSRQDLREQELSVYNAIDGKRLFFAANPGVSLAQQSFAISPAGTQLAVLSDSVISFYNIQQPKH